MEIAYEKQSGWKQTRASGILAILLSAYDMPWDRIFAWRDANNINHWKVSVNRDDYSASVGDEGFIMFDEAYPLPSDWLYRWNLWLNDQLDVSLPPFPEENSIAAEQIVQAIAAATPVVTSATAIESSTVSDAVANPVIQETAIEIPQQPGTINPPNLNALPVIPEPTALPPVQMIATQASAAQAHVGENSIVPWLLALFLM